MSKIRILCTSDVHIHNWPSPNTDAFRRPDRLTKYLTLADDMNRVADSNDVDVVVIAGDLVESSITRPQVLDVTREFLKKLSRNRPVHVITGNHDTDVRISDLSQHNSILTTVACDVDNLYYYSEPEYVDIKGFKFHFLPWRSEETIFGEDTADILVGHGIVPGSGNPQGYIFNKGSFDGNNLASAFNLSIIGDIHKHHLFERDGRCILIPGAPIQNSWNDDENCGFWIAEVDKEDPSESVFRFFNIHEVNPDTYHKFLYSETGEEEQTDLVHYYVKRKKKKKEEQEQEKKALDMNILDIGKNIITSSGNENIDSTLKYFEEYAGGVSPSIRMKPDIYIKSVEIKDFMSIENLTVDFESFNNKECAIIGKNGSGKTSIAESIYWCLTGNVTRDIKISNVKNWFSNDKTVSVKVVICREGKNIMIKRTRSSEDKPGLAIYYEDSGGSWMESRRGTIKETEREIEDVTGLTYSEIMMYSYFSTNKTVVYGELGDSAKNDIIAQIGGVDISGIHQRIKDDIKILDSKKFKSEGYISAMDYNINSKNESIEKLRRELKSSNEDLEGVQHIVDELTKKRSDISLKLASSDKNKLMMKWQKASSEINNIESNIRLSESLKEKAKIELAAEKEKLKLMVMENKCYVCGSPLPHPEEKIKEIQDNIKSFMKLVLENPPDRTKALENLKAEARDASSKLEEITKLTDELNKIDSSLREYNARIPSNNIMERIEALSEEKEVLVGERDEEGRKRSAIIEHIDSLTPLVSMTSRNGSLIKKINAHSASILQEFVTDVLSGMDVDIRVMPNYSLGGKFDDSKIYVPYASMSSGQKRVADVSLMVALNNLFCDRFGLKSGILGLCVYDEILLLLDEESSSVCREIISRSRSRRTFVISHNAKILSSFDSHIKVSMKKNISYYEMSV